MNIGKHSLEQVLEDFDILTEQIGELLRREQQNLKEGRVLDETAAEKEMLLNRLAELNTAMRAHRESGIVRMDEHQKRKIEFVQHKLMSILKTDRSLEKLYLANSVNRMETQNLKPVASRVSQVYGK